MRDLEDEIEELRDLNRLRMRSAELRNWGFGCLEAWVAEPKKVRKHEALIARVLLRKREQPAEDTETWRMATAWRERTLARLEMADLEALSGDTMRVTQVARTLVAAPGSAFSRAVLLCYYLLIRELYTIQSPDWSTGGAKTGPDGFVSAFATGHCVEALLGFAGAQEKTAKLIRDLDAVRKRSPFDENRVPEIWRKAELERSSLSFFTTLRLASTNLAVPVQVKNPQDARDFISDGIAKLRDGIQHAKENFEHAADAIEAFRAREAQQAEGGGDETLKRNLERSHAGHAVGLQAVLRAQENAEVALTLFDKSAADLLPDLARAFSDAALEVRDLLRPALAFVSGVLDREVAAALSGRPIDAAELTCAASTYGEIGRIGVEAASGGADDRWQDERLLVAVSELAKVVSEEGRFPAGRPLSGDAKGNTFRAYPGSLLRALALLLEKVRGAVVPPKLIERAIRFFELTKVNGDKQLREHGGWRHEWDLRVHPGAHLGVTASAVEALDCINRMLDERINQMVFRYFTVTPPRRGDLTLDGLINTDFGLGLAPKEALRKESVSIVLQRMRAHVSGILLPTVEAQSANRYDEPVYSVVLHGPPGTGKTTLLEALAASCEAPLVAVTPSDIVIRGEDSIEGRARAVFEALSLLTRVVILLDEFDPVLWRRNPDDTSPRSVFSFLTPGMLPKLKELHHQAGRRRVAFSLITNVVGGLDPAAIREGRFDRQLGIYPPDPLSRAGHFLSQLFAYRQGADLAPDAQQRACEVIIRTAGAGMPALVRKGWFRKPKDESELHPETPFHYVLEDGPEPVWPITEAKEYVQGEGDLARFENRQWLWIKAWDKRAAGANDPSTLFRFLEPPLPEVPKARVKGGNPSKLRRS
ncbi:MAG TPA: ATP-binding protein [Terriglobia bacterium]|nr:ATP-binding protein [Terriglobia bacterium]